MGVGGMGLVRRRRASSVIGIVGGVRVGSWMVFEGDGSFVFLMCGVQGGWGWKDIRVPARCCRKAGGAWSTWGLATSHVAPSVHDCNIKMISSVSDFERVWKKKLLKKLYL